MVFGRLRGTLGLALVALNLGWAFHCLPSPPGPPEQREWTELYTLDSVSASMNCRQFQTQPKRYWCLELTGLISYTQQTVWILEKEFVHFATIEKANTHQNCK